MRILEVSGTDHLVSDDESILLSVGDILTDKLNAYRSYEVISIDLHFISYKKVSVGIFESHEKGKLGQFITNHFVNGRLNFSVK